MEKTQQNISKTKTIGTYAAISALVALSAFCSVVGHKQAEALNKKDASYLGVAKNPQADLRGRSHIAYFDTDGDRSTAELRGYVDKRNIAKLEQASDTPMRVADWQRRGVEKVSQIHQKIRRFIHTKTHNKLLKNMRFLYIHLTKNFFNGIMRVCKTV